MAPMPMPPPPTEVMGAEFAGGAVAGGGRLGLREGGSGRAERETTEEGQE